MFSCALEKAACLRDIVLRIPSSATNGAIFVDSNMICFQAMDDKQYTMSGFKLYPAAFMWFDYNKQIAFTFEIESLVEIMKLINPMEQIKILIQNKGHIMFEIGTESECRRFLLQSRNCPYGHLKVASHRIDLSMHTISMHTILSLSSSEFDKICIMYKNNKHITIYCNYGKVRFEVNEQDIDIEYQLINPSRCTVQYSLHLINIFRQCRIEQHKINKRTFKTLIGEMIFNDLILNSLDDAFGIIMQFAYDVIDEYWLSQPYKGKSLVMLIAECQPLCIKCHTEIGTLEHYVAPLESDDE